MADTTKMSFKGISIKSFISDLPNIFNDNFKKIADFINSIYDIAKRKLHDIADIEVSGTVTANTIKAKNIIAGNINMSGDIILGSTIIKVKDQDGNIINIDILELEKGVARYIQRSRRLRNNRS